MAYFIHFVSNPLSIIIDTIKYQLSNLINSIRNQRFIKYDLLIEMIWLFENAWVLILFIKMFSENGPSQNMNSKFWLIYEWKLLSLVRDISNHILNIKILFYTYHRIDSENIVWISTQCKSKPRWDYFASFMLFYYMYMITPFNLLTFMWLSMF